MFDPYARDVPSVNDPANDLFLIDPSDSAELTRGVKALRIFNPSASAATIAVITVGGSSLSLTVPAESLWVEPLRVRAINASGTTAGLVIHGYTD